MLKNARHRSEGQLRWLRGLQVLGDSFVVVVVVVVVVAAAVVVLAEVAAVAAAAATRIRASRAGCT